jgi:hypothetical protein
LAVTSSLAAIVASSLAAIAASSFAAVVASSEVKVEEQEQEACKVRLILCSPSLNDIYFKLFMIVSKITISFFNDLIEFKQPYYLLNENFKILIKPL